MIMGEMYGRNRQALFRCSSARSVSESPQPLGLLETRRKERGSRGGCQQALHGWMSKSGGGREGRENCSQKQWNEEGVKSKEDERERERGRTCQKRVWVVLVSDKESFSKQYLKGTEDWQGYRRKKRREWKKTWMKTDRGQPMIQQGRAHVVYLSHIQFETVIPPLLFCPSSLLCHYQE